MRPVCPHLEAEKAAPVARVVCFQDERPGAVAEDHGPVPVRGPPGEGFRRDGPFRLAEHDGPLRVGPGIERGVALGADQENAAEGPRADEGVGDVKSGEKARALHPHVQCVGRRESQPRREQSAVAGEIMRRSHRREDDEVDVGSLEPRVVQGPARRLEAQVGGGGAGARQPALFDAGPLANPLIGRVHQA